jgi:hypothetical protein
MLFFFAFKRTSGFTDWKAKVIKVTNYRFLFDVFRRLNDLNLISFNADKS